jgi:hypothetical protein
MKLLLSRDRALRKRWLQTWADKTGFDLTDPRQAKVVKEVFGPRGPRRHWTIRKRVKLWDGQFRIARTVLHVLAHSEDFPTLGDVEGRCYKTWGGGKYEVWSDYPEKRVWHYELEGDPKDYLVLRDEMSESLKYDLRTLAAEPRVQA